MLIWCCIQFTLVFKSLFLTNVSTNKFFFYLNKPKLSRVLVLRKLLKEFRQLVSHSLFANVRATHGSNEDTPFKLKVFRETLEKGRGFIILAINGNYSKQTYIQNLISLCNNNQFIISNFYHRNQNNKSIIYSDYYI